MAKARDLVRQLLKVGGNREIEVEFAGGVYELEQFVEFSGQDAAAMDGSITYAGKPGAEVVFSGGSTVKNTPSRPGVWEGQIDLGHIAGQGEFPREVYVRQGVARRAREPDQDYFRVAQAGVDRRTCFQYDQKQFTPPADSKGSELVFLHDWSVSRIAIKSIEHESQTIQLEYPIGAAHDFFRIDGFEPHARFWVENAREFLDEPYEWYYSTQTQQLWIQIPQEQAADSVSVTVPRLNQLLRISGRPQQPVRGLRFRNIVFANTASELPRGGCAEIQASFFEPRENDSQKSQGNEADIKPARSRMPAAVTLDFAIDCRFENCQFVDIGGGAIYIQEECHQNQIANCLFDRIGGTAVMIGETQPRKDSEGKNLACADNIVRDSRISHCGQLLLGSVGIWIGIAQGTVVETNELFDLPYTGISVGWRWDSTPTGCERNVVKGNHIHHIMQALSDGGGIYTLGHQPGSILQANRIHDVPVNAGRAESNGIFMDEGSSLIEVKENVIFNIARSPIRFHKAHDNHLTGNDLTTRPQVEPFTYNACDPATMTMTDNQIRVANDSEKSPK